MKNMIIYDLSTIDMSYIKEMITLNSDTTMLDSLLLIKKMTPKLNLLFEKATNISLIRFEMLCYLDQVDQVSQVQLKKIIPIDQAAITRHLKILEEKKFVERNRNAKNQREILVKITPLGESVLHECDSHKQLTLNQLFEEFTRDEIYAFHSLLLKLEHNLYPDTDR
ncbi:hypothetical protein CBF30_00120 [Vagococcus entomophilus]|uniref:HTH marR-type domain-containing protein n=1 Tax=Vagococcus entomophilus TaxID=1160095 RepID=A0A430AI50_9ENTE|nr:hypothetical protein CBF30_00120 [Vagococcus entomophilus]